jgi:hypothetical protein
MNPERIIFKVKQYAKSILFKSICLSIGLFSMFVANAASTPNTTNYYSIGNWSPSYLTKQAFSGMICLESCQLSLDATGKVKVTPGMILKQPHGPEANYTTIVVGKNTDTITCQSIGQRIKVQVTENATNNACWTFVMVEDKLPPSVMCRDTTLLCTGMLSDLDSIAGLVVIGDNCTPYEYLKISHIDQIVQKDCSNDTFSTVTRKWTVLDPWGRAGYCTQKINLLRPAKADIGFPSDTTIYCPVTSTSPADLGQPTIGGLALGKFCGWIVDHKDLEYNKCGITKKILRTWSLFDCCALSDTTVMQYIIISDTARPTIVCRAADTVSTSFGQCESFFHVRPVDSAADACHPTNLLTTLVQVDHGFLTVPGADILLPVGTHILTYEVSDPCGNKSSCNTSVTVKDRQPPTLLCIDSMQLVVPDDNLTISAANFSSIQPYDNCGLLNVLIRRETTRCGNPTDVTSYKNEVSICCADINHTFNLVFLATDIYGNQDSCKVRIMVGDKTAPRLDCAQDDTLLCTSARPVWHNPKVGLLDNCVDSVKIKIDTLLNSINLCGIGQIRRRIIATDLANNKDTCFQQITIFATDTLTADDIVLPHDTIKIVGCSLDSLLPGKTSYVPPVVDIDPNGCNKIFITYVDTFRSTAGTSRCRITKRTWRVGDSCFSLTPVRVFSQIIIQDTTAFAPLVGTIAGQVLNYIQQPIEAVQVEGQNQKAEMIFHQMTDRNGTFQENQGLNITSVHLDKKESNLLNGISTLDLLQIQRHISGTSRFESVLQEYAADIDKNGDINIFDLILLRKIILGLTEGETHLPWVFTTPAVLNTMQAGREVPNAYSWPDNKDQKLEFVGFRMGDVNHDAIVKASINLESRNYIADDLLINNSKEGMTVSMNATRSINGLQLSLVSLDGWTGASIASDALRDLKYSIIGHELRISWVTTQPITIADHTALFTIKGSHPKTVKQGSLISQWYGADDLSHPIQIKAVQEIEASSSVVVFPNPVRDYLNIKLEAASNDPVRWRLVNQMGSTVRVGSGHVKPGEEIKVQTDRLGIGIYYLEVLYGKNTMTRHIISKVE